MTTSTRASLTAIDGQLHADHFPAIATSLPSDLKGSARSFLDARGWGARIGWPTRQSVVANYRADEPALAIKGASIGSVNGEGKRFTGRASISNFQSSRTADYIVFSALCLLMAVEIWRTLKDEVFNSYRPELHYTRGPGPKCREKRSQDHCGAPAGRCRA